MLPLLTLRALTVDQEQSCKEISYQAADINTIRTLKVQSSEECETPNCCMCLDSLNGCMEILGLGYVEQGMETQGSDGQQSDLFEGFKSVVG